MEAFINWRRGSESNRRIEDLQSPALPLGYHAQKFLLFSLSVNFDCKTVKLDWKKFSSCFYLNMSL